MNALTPLRLEPLYHATALATPAVPDHGAYLAGLRDLGLSVEAEPAPNREAFVPGRREQALRRTARDLRDPVPPPLPYTLRQDAEGAHRSFNGLLDKPRAALTLEELAFLRGDCGMDIPLERTYLEAKPVGCLTVDELRYVREEYGVVVVIGGIYQPAREEVAHRPELRQAAFYLGHFARRVRGTLAPADRNAAPLDTGTFKELAAKGYSPRILANDTVTFLRMVAAKAALLVEPDVNAGTRLQTMRLIEDFADRLEVMESLDISLSLVLHDVETRGYPAETTAPLGLPPRHVPCLTPVPDDVARDPRLGGRGFRWKRKPVLREKAKAWLAGVLAPTFAAPSGR